jgi:hypothetical protein
LEVSEQWFSTCFSLGTLEEPGSFNAALEGPGSFRGTQVRKDCIKGPIREKV